MRCFGPDNTNMCGRDDSRLQAGWISRDELGFMWDAAQGTGGLGSFPFPYVHVVRIVASTATFIDEPILANSLVAFAYPGVSINSSGVLGIVVAYAGSGSPHPGTEIISRDETAPGPWQVAVVGT